MLSVKNNGTYHLYAQWIHSNTAEHVTLTHIDRDDEYATYNYLKGDTVNVIDCDIERDNHTFKGWDTSSEAKTVVYAAADTFEITEHTTLYAVWEQSVKPTGDNTAAVAAAAIAALLAAAAAIIISRRKAFNAN